MKTKQSRVYDVISQTANFLNVIRIFKNIIIDIFLCGFIIYLMLYGFSSLGYLSLSSPIIYSYDASYYNAFIKSLVEQYIMHQHLHLGYLNGYTPYDFPDPVWFGYLQILFIAKLFNTTNPFLITNIYYLFSYLSVALCSLWVLRFYRIKFPLALAGAIIFTLLPYHFYRSTLHLFLSSYLTIPLWTLLCIEIYNKGKIILLNNKLANYALVSLIVIICATSGVYYAFFGCMFIFFSGTLALYHKQKKAFLLSLLIIITTVLILLLQILPTIINNHTAGSNIMAAIRSPMQTEIYGLRIAHLLLPSEYSRIGFLANISQAYNRVFFNDANESIYSHLGITTAIGFIILILAIFVDKIAKNNQIIKLMAQLNLIAVLFAVTGGFATLFSFFVMDEIRSVNRVSVFIAFFAILSLMLLIQRFIESKNIQSRAIYWLLSLLLIYIAAIDQIDPNAFDNRALAMQSMNDRNFVAAIENSMPKNSAIFELPFTDYPEPQILPNKLTTYELFVPYMYSHDLYWSYGATKGRSVAQWQEYVTSLPLSQMLNKLIAAGYTGLFIDNNGYKNPTGDILQPLASLLNTNYISSEDKHYAFFDLRNYIAKQQQNMTADKIKCIENNEKIDMQSYPVLGKGFEFQKTTIMNKLYNIAHRQANFTIFNPTNSTLSVEFNIVAPGKSGSENVTKLFLNDTLVNKYKYISQVFVPIKINLLPGYNHLKLKSSFEDHSQNNVLLMATDINKTLSICK